ITDADSGRIIRRPQAITWCVEAVTGIKQFATSHKNAAIGTAVVAGVVGIVTVGGVVISATRFAKCTKCSARLTDALLRYLDALCNGTVSTPILNELSRALRLYANAFSNVKCRSLVPYADINNLCVFALDYSKRLAEASSIAFKELNVRKRDNSILQLREYIEAQRRILARPECV
ncbi:MAG: hypothetical protein RR068_14355, partial [Hafnia sp.]